MGILSGHHQCDWKCYICSTLVDGFFISGCQKYIIIGFRFTSFHPVMCMCFLTLQLWRHKILVEVVCSIGRTKHNDNHLAKTVASFLSLLQKHKTPSNKALNLNYGVRASIDTRLFQFNYSSWIQVKYKLTI